MKIIEFAKTNDKAAICICLMTAEDTDGIFVMFRKFTDAEHFSVGDDVMPKSSDPERYTAGLHFNTAESIESLIIKLKQAQEVIAAEATKQS